MSKQNMKPTAITVADLLEQIAVLDREMEEFAKRKADFQGSKFFGRKHNKPIAKTVK